MRSRMAETGNRKQFNSFDVWRAGEEVLPHRRTWLLSIGRRLRAEYDAIAEPVPPRLAELIKQLEKPSTAESNQQETSRRPVEPEGKRRVGAR
jgi:hypothetical protein